MNKNTLGDLKLSPIKENGKFVFINSEVRVNGKLNKGDYIKIFVEAYEMHNGEYIVKNNSRPSSKMVVRGEAIHHDFATDETQARDIYAIEDLYLKIGEMYKNQFYFGKTAI